MGRLHARGVEETRIASIDHTFSPPGSISNGGDGGNGGDDPVPGTQGVVSIEDLEMSEADGEDQAAKTGFLSLLVSVLRENDPAEANALQVLARKLAGREYFLDPRIFNYRQVRAVFSLPPLAR